jgi:hypothetical protein
LSLVLPLSLSARIQAQVGHLQELAEQLQNMGPV